MELTSTTLTGFLGIIWQFGTLGTLVYLTTGQRDGEFRGSFPEMVYVTSTLDSISADHLHVDRSRCALTLVEVE
eukprot:scaffold616314_cov48-Prasinocladus_malaysianus.AAC.3